MAKIKRIHTTVLTWNLDLSLGYRYPASNKFLHPDGFRLDDFWVRGAEATMSSDKEIGRLEFRFYSGNDHFSESLRECVLGCLRVASRLSAKYAEGEWRARMEEWNGCILGVSFKRLRGEPFTDTAIECFTYFLETLRKGGVRYDGKPLAHQRLPFPQIRQSTETFVEEEGRSSIPFGQWKAMQNSYYQRSWAEGEKSTSE